MGINLNIIGILSGGGSYIIRTEREYFIKLFLGRDFLRDARENISYLCTP